jgi:hypothetical protein
MTWFENHLCGQYGKVSIVFVHLDTANGCCSGVSRVAGLSMAGTSGVRPGRC